MTASIKFEIFEDYLKSEFKTKGLKYICTGENLNTMSKKKIERDKHKVRGIIINNIDEKYYIKILELTGPEEIMSKIKVHKKLEIRTTSAAVRKKF